MSTASMLKHFAMVEGCIASLSNHSASKDSHCLLPLPSKSIGRLRLSCSSYCFSSLSSSFFLQKDKSLAGVALVVRTTGWVGEDSSEWSSRGVSDGDFITEDDSTVEEGSYPEVLEEAKLFVGNLPYDIDSEKLAHLFEGAGIVEVAEVIYNRETERSRGFGFITMSTVEEAEKAVEKYHQYDYNGRFLIVNKAAPRGSPPERSSRSPPRDSDTSRDSGTSLRAYVGNLPWQVDDSRLEQIFSKHGKVLSARVVCDRDTGRSRGFGFVTLSSRADLDDAIATLDGQTMEGRAIRVNVAEERSRRGSF